MISSCGTTTVNPQQSASHIESIAGKVLSHYPSPRSPSTAPRYRPCAPARFTLQLTSSTPFHQLSPLNALKSVMI